MSSNIYINSYIYIYISCDIISNSMVTYKCNRCKKIFKLKGDYTRHLNRKIPCKADDENGHNKYKTTAIELKATFMKLKTTAKVCKVVNNRECVYCLKIFARPYNLTVHLGKCKIKREKDQEKEDIMTKLIEEREEQKRKYEDMLAKKDIQIEKMISAVEKMISEQNRNKEDIKGVRNIQNADKIENNVQNAEKIQNNNIQNNHTVNQINIIAYGKEDLSHIEEVDYKRILNKGFKSIQEYVNYIHFNSKKPENHNMYISNLRDNYILVYDGNSWQVQERDNILQDIVDNKGEMLQLKFNEMVNRLDEPTVRKFQRFLDERDEKEVISKIKRDLKLLLYNKRNLVEDTKNS
jgi:hypothetical protein